MGVWLVAGTRPEIVKLAPVSHALETAGVGVHWVATGQHTDLAAQTFASFAMTPQTVLPLVRNGEGLAGVLGAMLQALDAHFAKTAPRLVIVQGDTSSALAGSLAAYARRIPIAHVEAGLRSFDTANPFPEETWRTLIGHMADLHFAPTARAAQNLKAGGVCPDRIHVTGNTVVDAVHMLAPHLPCLAAPAGRRLLVTLHRRENWGAPLERIAEAIRRIAAAHQDLEIAFVAHANGELSTRVHAELDRTPGVKVLPPLDYPAFLAQMRGAHLILTDSGGVQEEAPAFGVPVLVLRETTERPEAIDCGLAQLVGTQTGAIVEAVTRLLTDPAAHAQMARVASPYGDGKAGTRIAEILARRLSVAG